MKWALGKTVDINSSARTSSSSRRRWRCPPRQARVPAGCSTNCGRHAVASAPLRPRSPAAVAPLAPCADGNLPFAAAGVVAVPVHDRRNGGRKITVRPRANGGTLPRRR